MTDEKVPRFARVDVPLLFPAVPAAKFPPFRPVPALRPPYRPPSVRNTSYMAWVHAVIPNPRSR
jgi:hypothetical protein